MSPYDLTFLATLLNVLLGHLTSSSTVSLQSHNIDDILNHNEIVLVNFYADWCRFSQMLKPVYAETAKKLAEEFPASGSVVLGSVDCDRETSIAQKYQVTKYPTLKLFRNGQLIKREYRGQRSADAMANYIREQMKDPVIRSDNTEALDEINTKKRHMIGYFDTDDGVDYTTFRKVGSLLREDCLFHAVMGAQSEQERITGNRIMFRPAGDLSTDVLYTGPLEDYNLFLKWATDKCVPLVREITFENAEELTEEGLPFMILFHHIDDTETPEKFKSVVARELLAEKNSMNFLTADGEKFTHPLHHLGKTSKDLPILAIDSFRHMYIWKHDPKKDLDTSGLLKEFVKDLQSGKLHREFHHGPDKVQVTESPNGENKDSALATKDDSDQDNVVHFNVQQQVIVHSNGVRMQVVRFVQIGHQPQIDLREHLSAANALLGNGNGDDNVINMEDQKIGDKPSDNADKDPADKDPADHIDLDDSDKPLGSDNVNTDSSQGKVDDMQKNNDHATPREDNKVDINDNSFDDNEVNSESSTKSYVRMTQVQMKIEDGQYAEDKKLPPNSIFRKLAPSNDRYTILNNRDEL